MSKGMWTGVGLSFIGMALILLANAMRFMDDTPNTYRYKVACHNVIAMVDVHAPRELTEADEEKLRDKACAAIAKSLEIKIGS